MESAFFLQNKKQLLRNRLSGEAAFGAGSDVTDQADLGGGIIWLATQFSAIPYSRSLR